MFYVEDIITSADTSKSVAVTTSSKFWAGVIHKIEVMFPPGCAGLLHVRIFHQGHQVYPSDEDQSFAGDDETVSFNDYYELQPGANTLKIETWNEDDTYSHTVHVRVGVLPAGLVNPRMQFTAIAGSLRTLLRRIGVTD